MPSLVRSLCIAACAVVAWLCHVPIASAMPRTDENALVKATYNCSFKGKKCIVNQCYGSHDDVETNDFIVAAGVLFKTGYTLVINGDFGSACIVGADRLLAAARNRATILQLPEVVRDTVCVTPNARLLWHQGWKFIDPKKGSTPGNVIYGSDEFYLNDDLQEWVRANSPLPRTRKIEEALVMSSQDIQRFWPLCGKEARREARN